MLTGQVAQGKVHLLPARGSEWVMHNKYPCLEYPVSQGEHGEREKKRKKKRQLVLR